MTTAHGLQVRSFQVHMSSCASLEAAAVQWNHACFEVRRVSKRTGPNLAHGPSLDILSLRAICFPLTHLVRPGPHDTTMRGCPSEPRAPTDSNTARFPPWYDHELLG
ncbi:hypothetical protein E2C01_065203 [Portunus trituberculatus]|uniref:Uncharacterized protein n=1 Tax=Portunus trituberculatus TaxID=210409 RepID=A0A5B7HQF0_PORTR|nr:hypothetical protein [Portunus trituberculatus]